MRENAIQKAIAHIVRKEYGGRVVKVDETIYSHEPDLHIYLPGPATVFIEVKQPGEKPTKGQQLRIDEYRRMGFAAGVCTSAAEARVVLSAVTETYNEGRYGR